MALHLQCLLQSYRQIIFQVDVMQIMQMHDPLFTRMIYVSLTVKTFLWTTHKIKMNVCAVRILFFLSFLIETLFIFAENIQLKVCCWR